MVRGKGVAKQILSPGEIKDLQMERKEIETNMRELDEGAGAGTRAAAINRANLQKAQQRLDKTIVDHSPKVIRGGDKDRLASKAQELREKISQGMPSYDQMWKPTAHPGIVRQNLDWQRRNAGNINEYKQVMRQLEPGDPSASSVERFRRK
jgi:hypothetical protein